MFNIFREGWHAINEAMKRLKIAKDWGQADG